MYADFYLPLINKPTRISNHSMTLIDNIFFNGSSAVDSFSGILFTDISDHFPIFCISKTLKKTNDTEEYFYKRCYSSDNMSKFRDNLRNLDWTLLNNDFDPQNAFTHFHSTICTLHNKYFPLKRFKKGYSNRKPWLKPASSGWDDLPGRIFRDNIDYLTEPLLHIINLSLSKGVFPTELKIAKVLPLYKGNEKNILKNYRPISLLPVLSKIFEKVMYNRLISFLNINDLLYKLQFGFRKKHSTNTALIVLTDKIASELAKGNFVLGVFLDYSKAFDCVNHAILLQKLYHYGIRGVAFDWFKSYLSSRKQYVQFNGIHSGHSEVKCGVPQGSVLGPILFLLYINDIVNVSNILYPILFADDSNVFLSGNNIDNLINSMNIELEKLMVWLAANKLSLNVGKTNFMIFSPPKKKPVVRFPILIQGTEIKQIFETKFLGVVVDHKLNWEGHINYISRKISRGIGILSKARKYLPKTCLQSLYFSFVYPYCDYCIEVWGKATHSALSKIIKLQKRAVRTILSKPPRTPSKPLFDSLKLLSLENIYKYKVGIYMFKLNHDFLPKVCSEMFIKNSEVYSYETRSKHCFHVPFPKTNLLINSIRYQGVMIGNLFTKKVNSNCSIFTYKKD